MLRLSHFCKSKQLWSVGYVSMGCDDINGWSFGGTYNECYIWVPDDEWLIWVPDTDWISLGSTLDRPLKT